MEVEQGQSSTSKPFKAAKDFRPWKCVWSNGTRPKTTPLTPKRPTVQKVDDVQNQTQFSHPSLTFCSVDFLLYILWEVSFMHV